MHAVTFYRAEAIVKQAGKCFYCKCPITHETATADHKWPRARRGFSTPENIVAACEPCNLAKRDMSEGAFFKLIDKKRPVTASLDILLIWASRRIWKRTYRACKQINLAASIPAERSHKANEGNHD
jgi:hypothetical protein